MATLTEAISKIQAFQAGSLTARLSGLEFQLIGRDSMTCGLLCSENTVDLGLVDAAIDLNLAAGQISVIIHAIGILFLLPRILESGEVIQYASLGAGNTGRPFDLETDRRVAEFKFTQWRGGPEAVRQNELFKDFFNLAEHETDKTRCLYVLDTTHPLKFLNGGRSIFAGKKSVVSGNKALHDAFLLKYGEHRFTRVGEYYSFRKVRVQLVDIASIAPDLAALFRQLL